MVMFKNKNVRGQRDGTRSRAVIDRVHERARAQASKYRTAREAKYTLCGGGPWEEVLRVLMDGDVRGYQDKNRLRVRTGRLGTLDDDQLEAAGGRNDSVSARTLEDVDMEDGAGITLEEEQRTRRDGTGETHRTLSWIWTMKSRAPKDKDYSDDILRSEWVKSRARANRCKEEVLLLREEMRRVLLFLEWKNEWWSQWQDLREGLSPELDEGLKAFAMGQADLQQRLAAHFQGIWKGPLDDRSTENLFTTDTSSNDVDNPEEEDDDDDNGDDNDEDDSDDDNRDEFLEDLGLGEDNEGDDY